MSILQSLRRREHNYANRESANKRVETAKMIANCWLLTVAALYMVHDYRTNYRDARNLNAFLSRDSAYAHRMAKDMITTNPSYLKKVDDSDVVLMRLQDLFLPKESRQTGNNLEAKVDAPIEPQSILPIPVLPHNDHSNKVITTREGSYAVVESSVILLQKDGGYQKVKLYERGNTTIHRIEGTDFIVAYNGINSTIINNESGNSQDAAHIQSLLDLNKVDDTGEGFIPGVHTRLHFRDACLYMFSGNRLTVSSLLGPDKNYEITTDEPIKEIAFASPEEGVTALVVLSDELQIFNNGQLVDTLDYDGSYSSLTEVIAEGDAWMYPSILKEKIRETLEREK